MPWPVDGEWQRDAWPGARALHQTRLLRASACGSVPGSDRYDVSVVIPTYNRQFLLSRTLDSLLHQDCSGVRYEVLVVDNGSSDGTRAVVETFTRQSPHVRYLFEPRRGVSHARNTGIDAARAPIIAFIDDDVEASPTWITRIKQVFDTHREIDCVGGRIHPRWAATPPSWLTPLFWGAVALQDKSDTPYLDANHASACLATANFACRRNALDEVGGFSPDLVRDEDRELQMRMWAAGKRGLYVGEIEVTTEVPPDRLTKRYHRQFWIRSGETRARMRYLERIDANGRLLPETRTTGTVLGTPAFVYRELLGHLSGLIWHTATLQRDRAFFHETRLLYFANYIRSRYREERPALRAAPRELYRVQSAVLNRMRSRATRAFRNNWQRLVRPWSRT
jgi:glycosyltransferase involved in cell wall biosynthesis